LEKYLQFNYWRILKNMSDSYILDNPVQEFNEYNSFLSKRVAFFNHGYYPMQFDSGEFWAPSESLYYYTFAKALEHLNAKPENALDVGGGRGSGAYYLKQKFKDVNFSVADITAKNYEFCLENYGNEIQCFNQDAQYLDFPSEHFDCITNVESSHYYVEMEKFIFGVENLLKPNGVFAICDTRDVRDWEVGYLTYRKWIEDNTTLRLVHDEDISENVLAGCSIILHRVLKDETIDKKTKDWLIELNTTFVDYYTRGVNKFFLQVYKKSS
jgi:ubiquinone/menaquinone biosynthesis C-methylase UbiE